jgi:2'-5' RNA ligase
MARQGPKSPRARLFIAIDPPDRVREALIAWQDEALTDPALRPMRPEALHITLCFLGDQEEGRIPRIAGALATIDARPVELRLDSEASPLPKGRPALYAVGARSEAAVALQAELAEALASRGLYEPDKRAFWPHLTVARVRSERSAPGRGERRGKGRPRRVAKSPSALPKPLTEPFGAVRMALYRSILKPQGAEYVRLDGVDLPSA